ncbi:hypothetical protein BC834DRAFT_287087 [Gloeopeniophorella convolvens]|nr:hypothetical protein BC834DRAFT_287087 [Gloeopeniophorella convolvens]
MRRRASSRTLSLSFLSPFPMQWTRMDPTSLFVSPATYQAISPYLHDRTQRTLSAPKSSCIAVYCDSFASLVSARCPLNGPAAADRATLPFTRRTSILQHRCSLVSSCLARLNGRRQRREAPAGLILEVEAACDTSIPSMPSRPCPENPPNLPFLLTDYGPSGHPGSVVREVSWTPSNPISVARWS